MTLRQASSGELRSAVALVNANNDTTPPIWVRPSDWLAWPTTIAPTDQVFYGLLAITNDDGNFLALSAGGNYTVDWGDGSATENISSGTQANHLYTWASVSSGTLTSEGFRQVIVTITPQAAQSLTNVILQRKHTQSGLQLYTAQWLEVYMGSPNLSSLSIGAGTSTVRTGWLRAATVVSMSASLTTMGGQFGNCYALQYVSLPSTAAITNFSQMFIACNSLRAAPAMDTSAGTNFAAMFQNCFALVYVPLYNTTSATDLNNMFSGCRTLTTVPLLNTPACLNFSSMFANCSALTSIPAFNTAAGTNFSSFVASTQLTTIPLLNTASGTNFSSMFSSCRRLLSIPLINTAAGTNLGSMFINCNALIAIPLLVTSAATDMSNFAGGCTALLTVPQFSTAACTNMTLAFASSTALRTVPLLNTAAVTNMISMFSGCTSLESIPTFVTSAVTTGNFATMFNGTCVNLASATLSGTKFAIDYTGCKLSTTALEAIFDNLGAGVSSPAITITNNWGATTIVSLAGTTTSGSATVTMASTTGLAVGMEIAGTGISTAVAVTFTDVGDLVTRTAHGLLNGQIVSFPTIVTTTGIVVNTPYYVVNKAANTFQVSLTNGGAAIALTTNGSGTLFYGTTISAITVNTNVTLSVVASASGSITTTSSVLKRSKAILHGFTVTG